MCLSTHEMNSAQLEQQIVSIEGWIQARPDDATFARIYGGRVDAVRKILKDRADAGTYNDDFEAAARAERERYWAEDD